MEVAEQQTSPIDHDGISDDALQTSKALYALLATKCDVVGARACEVQVGLC